MKDTLFDSPLSLVPAFTFGPEVVEVFDDMISRSVPLYQEVATMSASLASEYAQEKTAVYDLGCSTATTLIAISKLLRGDSIKLIGLDSSEAMIQEARTRLRSHDNIALECADILSYPYGPCSVVVCNYTLQFLPIAQRQQLLQTLYSHLEPGGIVILSEKVRHNNERLQTVLTKLHHDFKRSRGYSELEIAQKRASIENVLIPLPIEENIEMLSNAGFKSVFPVLSWYTFVTLVAIKQ